MIKSIRHKGLKAFYETNNVRGINPEHAKRLRARLTAMETATDVADLDIQSFRLHQLSGVKAGRWSVSVSGNWRLTFEFKGGNVYLLEYEDYH